MEGRAGIAPAHRYGAVTINCAAAVTVTGPVNRHGAVTFNCAAAVTVTGPAHWHGAVTFNCAAAVTVTAPAHWHGAVTFNCAAAVTVMAPAHKELDKGTTKKAASVENIVRVVPLATSADGFITRLLTPGCLNAY